MRIFKITDKPNDMFVFQLAMNLNFLCHLKQEMVDYFKDNNTGRFAFLYPALHKKAAYSKQNISTMYLFAYRALHVNWSRTIFRSVLNLRTL